MSLNSSSRKPQDLAQIPALAMVQARVSADETLPRRRRQDIASALRTVATALGRSLDELPAHPGQLRDRLKGFTPAMAASRSVRIPTIAAIASD